MKKIKYHWIALCYCCFSWAVFAQASSPVPSLEDAANRIVMTLKAHQSELKKNHNIVMQAVRESLLPHVDVVGMSRSVLGRNVWSHATPAERHEFTQVFTELVIRTYAAPLSEYSGETITFSSQYTSDGHFARVSSVIKRQNGQSIPLSYALIMKDDGWKVYDLNVEGISLLQSFKNQFAQALQGSDIKILIHDMKQHQLAAV